MSTKFDSELIVAVWMVTYNHEQFISKAIESVLLQNTKFRFRLFIGEDCSTDNTRAICLAYKEQNPDKIEIIFQPSNTGGSINANNLYLTCYESGAKYVALIEGDDYWTDPYKLQKQVDFLEANPKISLCFHPVEVLFPDGHTEEDYLVKGLMDKQESTLYDMAALGNYIHTPSVVYRNRLNQFPKQFTETSIGDFFLYMLIGRLGNYYRLPDTMAVYRHGVGMHSVQSGSERSRRWIKTLELISEVMDDNSAKAILDYRIASQRMNSLPKNLRNKENFQDINKAETLGTYVSWKELMKALFKKIL